MTMNASTCLQFMQARPLLRGFECLLAAAFDAREDSDIIARMDGKRGGGRKKDGTVERRIKRTPKTLTEAYILGTIPSQYGAIGCNISHR